MAYHYKVGVIVPFLQKYFKQITITVAAIFIASMAMMTLSAKAATATTFVFTPENLANEWGPERIEPSGGYSSVAYAGRNNVAAISIDAGNVNSNPYYRTEGIKTKKGPADNFSVAGNFGQSVEVDLYLDPVWDNTAVRAGLWTVGDNGSGGTDAANYPFGILEFANVAGYEGFRVWDSTIGYVNVTGFTGYGDWVTFNITLDPNTDEYIYSINSTEVERVTAPAVSNYLYSVLLNQRNFGLDDQVGLDEVSYTAHWSATLVEVEAPSNLRWVIGENVVACGGITSEKLVAPTWDAVDGATSYDYQYMSPGSSIWTDGGNYASTSTGNTAFGTVDGIEGTWQFRVRAVVNGSVSDWSDGCSIIYDNSSTPELLTTKEQCKDGGWMWDDRGFKNQGDCVSYFATKMKNKPAGTTTTTNARNR